MYSPNQKTLSSFSDIELDYEGWGEVEGNVFLASLQIKVQFLVSN